MLRSKYDCVLSTSKTINFDDPLLNCRINGLNNNKPDLFIIDLKLNLKKNLSLNNHLKRHIKKLGNGKQATNFKKIGDFSSRIHYVNKSLLKYDFDGWEHIDIQNSDL